MGGQKGIQMGWGEEGGQKGIQMRWVKGIQMGE